MTKKIESDLDFSSTSRVLNLPLPSSPNEAVNRDSADGIHANFLINSTITNQRYVYSTGAVISSITLPSAIGFRGELTIVHDGSNDLALTTIGAETIRGLIAPYKLKANKYSALTIISNGTNWLVI
jgi:hypothetical protein